MRVNFQILDTSLIRNTLIFSMPARKNSLDCQDCWTASFNVLPFSIFVPRQVIAFMIMTSTRAVTRGTNYRTNAVYVKVIIGLKA